MSENSHDPSRSEQSVIDELVAAVEAGDSESKFRLATDLLNGYSQRGWKRRVMVGSGIILLQSELDPTTSSYNIFDLLEEADVPDTRLEEISEGAPLTNAEFDVWRESVLERAFDDGLVYECGAGNICVVLAVKHSNRRICHLAVRDWDGQSGVFVAAYSTYDEAVKALRSIGIVRMDDYVMWEDRYLREDC